VERAMGIEPTSDARHILYAATVDAKLNPWLKCSIPARDRTRRDQDSKADADERQGPSYLELLKFGRNFGLSPS